MDAGDGSFGHCGGNELDFGIAKFGELRVGGDGDDGHEKAHAAIEESDAT